ncbi:hypothetical protein [Halostagnicola sp. A-GB9-2]|uniref:hypothetical protein n=1 Tax=Halostagnicola sp. A-GB9-2 TaxID=3048066 RepID=UPI0024C040AB|nr:hypothetical protein [Halostagnicola sp. A-GB9-2]MDJ1433568.1 hypothetical protein [Halostagnicola sp. A-GB9-2]
MGKINPTYRAQLSWIEDDWSAFRRALRAEHQGDFDCLFGQARDFADAADHQNAMDPMEPLSMSILLAHEKRIAEFEEQVMELEAE